MDKGSLVLVEGVVSTVVLGRGVKKVVSWDDTWAGMASRGFIRVLEMAYPIYVEPEPEPAPEPVRKTRAKKAAPTSEPVVEEPVIEPDADA